MQEQTTAGVGTVGCNDCLRRRNKGKRERGRDGERERERERERKRERKRERERDMRAYKILMERPQRHVLLGSVAIPG